MSLMYPGSSGHGAAEAALADALSVLWGSYP